MKKLQKKIIKTVYVDKSAWKVCVQSGINISAAINKLLKSLAQNRCPQCKQILKVLFLALILTGCGGGGSGVGSIASPSNEPAAACMDGSLTGSYTSIGAGDPDTIGISQCAVQYGFGVAQSCIIRGTIFNRDNSGGVVDLTVTEKIGVCGDKDSGTCQFNVTGDQIELSCPSLGVNGFYERN